MSAPSYTCHVGANDCIFHKLDYEMDCANQFEPALSHKFETRHHVALNDCNA